MARAKRPLLSRRLPDQATNQAMQEVMDAVKEIQDDLPKYAIVSMTVTTALIAQDIVLRHDLGYIPTAYIVLSKTAPCDVYDGTRTASSRTITLRGNSEATVVLKVY